MNHDTQVLPERTASAPRGMQTAELSNAMVRIYKEHQEVRDIRTFFQHASEPEFVEAVEQITGHSVRAFVSGTDTEHDVSSEVFYLHAAAGAEAINGG
jgi:uncharacterized protein YbcI